MSPNELLELVRAGGPLAAGRPVVVMLSGGRDSVCLLDVAAELAGAGAVRALHVNYGLRAAAADDETFCAHLCDRLGIELAVHRSGSPAATGNVQAWAREVRYAAAAELAAAFARSCPALGEPADVAAGVPAEATAREPVDIAAGHTATDQVETILYRLASSPSRRALLGMRMRDGNLVRPLLRCTREQTAAYCSARGLPWRDDETNDSDRYARGRVRGGLVPALRAIHPAAQENVLALAETLRTEAEVLDELVDDVLGGGLAVSLEQLRALRPALARLVVQRLADAAAGRPAPGTARRLDDILALRDTGTAALDLPCGVRATAVRGVVSFAARP